MGNPKFFAWPFLANHFPVCFLTPLRQDFSLPTDLPAQNLRIISTSHLSSISWQAGSECPSNLWCRQTKPKISVSASPHCAVGCSYLLLQVPPFSASPSLEPTSQWVPNWDNCPFFFVFLSDGPQGHIILGLHAFYFDSNTSPYGRLTFLLFFCDWNKSPGQVHYAWFPLSQGNSFQGTYSGLVLKALKKPSRVCLNYSDGWSTDFFLAGTNIFPSGLFYQFDKYIWIPAVGSRNPCITSLSQIITVII